MRDANNRQRCTDLREERAGLVAQAEEKVEKLETITRNGGSNSANGAEMVDRLESQATGLQQRIDGLSSEIRRLEAGDAEGGQPQGGSRAMPHEATEARGIGGHVPNGTASSVEADRSAALGHGARVMDWQARHGAQRGGLAIEEAREVNLDRVLGSWIGGRREGLNDAERRVLSEGVDAAGGFTVPSILGAGLIDRARNAAKVIVAGALTVPVESDEHSIARLSGGVTGTWRAENAAVTEDDPALRGFEWLGSSHWEVDLDAAAAEVDERDEGCG